MSQTEASRELAQLREKVFGEGYCHSVEDVRRLEALEQGD